MSDTYIPPFPTGNSSNETNYTQAFDRALKNRTKPGSNPNIPEPVRPRTPSHAHSQPNKIKPGNKPVNTTKPVNPNYSPLHHQASGGNSKSTKSGGSDNGHKPVNPNYSPLHHQASGGSSKTTKSGGFDNGHKPVNPNYSPLHHQGSGGSSKSGSSHNGNRPVNPNYQNYPSPKPARSEREKKEGQIGNYSKSPYNNTPYNNNNNKSPYNNTDYNINNHNNSPYNAPRRNEQTRSKKKQGGQTPLSDGILPPFPTGTDTGSNYTEMFNRYHNDNMSPAAPAMTPYQSRDIPTHKTRRCCIL